MKTFEQLTDEQKAKAVAWHEQKVLEAVVEGSLRFNDEMNHDDLQKRIDAAWAEVERLHTPWFAGEAIWETCSEELNGIASANAERSLYSEPDEFVVDGILEAA
jgi:hypothetical protein